MSGPAPSLSSIIDLVSFHFDVTRKEVLSPRRRQELVIARHAGMWLARETTAASFPQIGRQFGKRDHSSVMYAVRRVGELMRDDEMFCHAMLGLRDLLTQRVAA